MKEAAREDADEDENEDEDEDEDEDMVERNTRFAVNNLQNFLLCFLCLATFHYDNLKNSHTRTHTHGHNQYIMCLCRQSLALLVLLFLFILPQICSQFPVARPAALRLSPVLPWPAQCMGYAHGIGLPAIPLLQISAPKEISCHIETAVTREKGKQKGRERGRGN